MPERAVHSGKPWYLLIFLVAAAGACGLVERPADELPTARPIEGAEMLYRELIAAGLQVERAGAFRLASGASGQRWSVAGEPLFVFEIEPGTVLAPGELADLAGNGALTWENSKVRVAYAGSEGGVRLVLGALLGDPSGMGTLARDEPFPPAVLAAIQAVAKKFDRDPADLQVLNFEEREWPDDCLGLQQDLPEAECSVSPTQGWLVEILAGSERVRIRTDAIGNLIRLETPSE